MARSTKWDAIPATPWRRLEIRIDGQTVCELEVGEAHIEMARDMQELRSNPSLAAAMSGAPPEVLASMPGEMRAYLDAGAEITIRFRGKPGGVSEWKPVSSW